MSNYIEKWDVEDLQFWETTGKRIANRNLWVSIPNLLCGFSVWLYWGMIAKTMQRLHFANPELFDFTFRNNGASYDEAGYRALLFTLPAVQKTSTTETNVSSIIRDLLVLIIKSFPIITFS